MLQSVLNYTAICNVLCNKEEREEAPHIHGGKTNSWPHTDIQYSHTKSVKPDCESVTESGKRNCGGSWGLSFFTQHQTGLNFDPEGEALQAQLQIEEECIVV